MIDILEIKDSKWKLTPAKQGLKVSNHDEPDHNVIQKFQSVIFCGPLRWPIWYNYDHQFYK